MVGVYGDFIRHKGEGWGQTGGNVLPHLRPQDTFGGFQGSLCRSLLLFGTIHRVVHGCVLQIVGDAGVCDGHEPEPGVFDTTL